MVLLDIKAAFDSVWHEGLIHKMMLKRFPAELVKIVQSFLRNRSFKVHIGANSSNSVAITAGCPQGSCLSPVLYNIFTADFPSLEGCTTSIFTDDTAILCSGVQAEDILTNLEASLTKIQSYFTKWRILINPTKTQAIYFSRKRKPCFLPQRCIKLNNTDIQWETSVKYLGVLLDTKTKFGQHIAYVINKINNTTRILYPFINRKSSMNVENKLLILKVIFHAILFYGSPVWCSTAKCHIKKLQTS